MDIHIRLATTDVVPNDGYAYDTDRLVSAYREQVEAQVAAAYPEATVQVEALPRTLQTRILVDGVSLRDEDAITAHVEQILSQAWEGLEWDQYCTDPYY